MPFGKPPTFEDEERIEIEKRKIREQKMKRNAIIIYAVGGMVICLLALVIAQALGGV